MKKHIKMTPEVHAVKARLRRLGLHTVCEEARCPNMCECFGRGTAAFMILGDTCTRSCGFCGVKRGVPLPPDPGEPARVAEMASKLGLRHVVITSVTRDDLPDEGAGQFAAAIRALTGGRSRGARPRVEVLTPDFHARKDCLRRVCDAGPDIFNHNIETVRRLTGPVRPHADYDRSLEVLSWVKDNYPDIITKSGLMAGLGETREEVLETLSDLCKASCRVVTIGQYLAPSRAHTKVAEHLPEEAFKEYKVLGERLGIEQVFSGPFVRSSYMADRTIC